MGEEGDDGEAAFYSMALRSGYVSAIMIWAYLMHRSAPYGRHKVMAGSSVLARWSIIPSRWAWAIMESPSLFLTPIVFSKGRYASHATPRLLISFFVLHYANRVLIYPFRIKPSADPRNIPLSIFISALAFNVYNAYIQGRGLSHYNSYGPEWTSTRAFACGVTLFLVGMAINVWADSVLIGLRREGKNQDKVSCSNDDGKNQDKVSCSNDDGKNQDKVSCSNDDGKNQDKVSCSNDDGKNQDKVSCSNDDGKNQDEVSCSNDDGKIGSTSATTSYKIPRGGLFELVTCPNYLGEIMEWFGWGLATWSSSGFLFSLLTAANLVPRAMAHHRWYLHTFPHTYPSSRRILLPFLF